MGNLAANVTRDVKKRAPFERDARCQKTSAILAQTEQLGEIVATDCNGSVPSPCSQNRKPAVMAGFFADKCGETA